MKNLLFKVIVGASFLLMGASFLFVGVLGYNFVAENYFMNSSNALLSIKNWQIGEVKKCQAMNTSAYGRVLIVIGDESDSDKTFEVRYRGQDPFSPNGVTDLTCTRMSDHFWCEKPSK